MARLEDIIKPQGPKLTEDYQPTNVGCKLRIGAAGTGKTTLTKKELEEHPEGILCATTGIAAINLGAPTLNSVLKFYDTESLRDRLNRGTLTSTLHKLCKPKTGKKEDKKSRTLFIDEISMMDGRQLDYIFKAAESVNTFQDMEDNPMRICLIGDFLQLPPVKAPWAFESECWKHFERNTEKLTKVWRQDSAGFLEALNYARAGKGIAAVEALKGLGVKFVPQTHGKFPGTTIMSKNAGVDNYNFAALLDVPGNAYGLRTQTWGEQAGEWKNIPEVLKLKDGAYVMILANDTESGLFEYANGDCGTIQQKDADGTIWIKLARNGKLVPIRPIIRYKTVSQKDGEKLGLDAFGEKVTPAINQMEIGIPWEHPKEEKAGPSLSPESVRMTHIYCDKDCGWNSPGIKHGPWGQPSYNCQNGTYNIGAIKFYPLRLAYATTVHKSQGLTLDKCQIDCRDHFFGEPGMAYVALSRCRTAEGLTIVGDPGKLAERIRVEPKVLRWV